MQGSSRTRVRLRCAAIFFFVLVLTFSAEAEEVHNADRVTPEGAKAVEAWRKFVTDAAAQINRQDDVAADDWFDLMHRSHDRIWGVLRTRDRAAIRKLVHRLGKSDEPLERLMLVVTDYHLSMPMRSMLEYEYKPTERFPLPAKLVWQQRAVFVEEMVRMLVANPKVLTEYKRMAMWSRYFLIPERSTTVGFLAENTWDGLSSADRDAERWWYARNALVLLAATDKLDVLDPNEADVLERIRRGFIEWSVWLYFAKHYLVCDGENMVYRYDPGGKGNPPDADALEPIRGLKKFPKWGYLDMWYNMAPY